MTASNIDAVFLALQFPEIQRYVDLYRPLHEECSNTEFFQVRVFMYSVRIQKNTEQKNLPRIWTLFTQWTCLSSVYKSGLLASYFIFPISNNNSPATHKHSSHIREHIDRAYIGIWITILFSYSGYRFKWVSYKELLKISADKLNSRTDTTLNNLTSLFP